MKNMVRVLVNGLFFILFFVAVVGAIIGSIGLIIYYIWWAIPIFLIMGLAISLGIDFDNDNPGKWFWQLEDDK